MAVECATYGAEPYASEHAHYFQDEVVMPTTIVLDPDANIAHANVCFLHFLLSYFHRALQPLLRKVYVQCVIEFMYIECQITVRVASSPGSSWLFSVSLKSGKAWEIKSITFAIDRP